MSSTEQTISGLIESQLPDFINAKYADNAPSFRRFIELYYEWLEDSAAGNTVYHIMNSEKYRDIDETEDSFITYFKDELLPYFPERTELELVKILKGAKEFYQKKGTAASIQWLFRVLYNKEAIISFPRENILRASDGKWQKPIALKVSDTPFVVQTAEATQNLYAPPAAPSGYYTQNTFSTSVKFSNTLRRDSTVFIFVAYKVWVVSATSGSSLRDTLVNFYDVNPSTKVIDSFDNEYTLVERIISEDMSGFGANQHGYHIIECYYRQEIEPEANKISFVNYMTPTILETIFNSASGSTLFQVDGIEAIEICKLGKDQLITSNGIYYSDTTSVESTVTIDGSNTPSYVISFAYCADQSEFIDSASIFAGGTSSSTGTEVADGGTPSTTVFDDTIDGGIYSTESGVATISTIIPDELNNFVIANTTFGEGNFALQYTKKYNAQDVISYFSSGATANIGTISLAFKERESVALKDLVGKLVIGETSKARAVIERAFVRVDEYTKTKYTEIFLSNVQGEFVNNELIYADIDDVFFTERILGFVNSIRIDPNNRGLKYKINDPAVIYGGFVDEFGNRPTAGFNYATAIVSDATEGRILSVQLLKGGYGYRADPNTTIQVIPDVSDPPISVDAEVEVSGVDTGNAITLSLATDTIAPYASVTLSTNPFNPSPSTWGTGFPIKSDANITSVLSDCLGFENIDFYPISALTLTNQGQGYLREPTLEFTTLYPVNGGTADIRNLGLIAAVEIADGGVNYANGELLIFSGGGGSSAVANVEVNGSGAITGINILSRGYGYTTRPTVTVDTVAGAGASLIAYLFNDGVEYDLTVEEVGQIRSLEIVNSGFGYVARPNVSLKVMDVYTDNLTRVFSADQEFTVFQGADLSTSTFRANIDMGYVSSISQAGSANATIRLYEYDGVVNVAAPLKITQTGDHLNLLGSLIYGNGLAKANLLFIDGTTTYPGFYLNTDGFLSADKKLQDNYKYHNFSYVLESDKQLREYNQTIKNTAHPAGSKLIAHKRISDVFSFRPSVSHGFAIAEKGYILAEDGSYITAEDGVSYLSQE